MRNNRSMMMTYIVVVTTMSGMMICLPNVAATDLTLNDLEQLNNRQEYQPVGFGSIVENMGAAVVDSLISPFSSALTSASPQVNQLMNIKSLVDQGNLFYKMKKGTATMNELAGNPFTMQYSIALPLLNVHYLDSGKALGELNDAFNIPKGDNYYRFLEKEYGLKNINYPKSNLPRIKIDFPKINMPKFPNWNNNIPKISYPSDNFPKITIPDWSTPSWNNPTWNNPSWNNLNNPISTPSWNNFP